MKSFGFWKEIVLKPLTYPSHTGSQILKNGARRNKLEEPLVMDQEYSIQWRELRVNLAELAKLRYLEGWDRNKLAEHYQRTLYAITNYCQAIRKKNFNLEGLTEAEKEKIRWAYQN